MPRKKRQKKSSPKRKVHKKNKPEMNDHPNRCSFCGNRISGIPHRCKYCGKKHCDDHLVPEDHKCRGLEKTDSWSKPKARHSHYSSKKYKSYNKPQKRHSHLNRRRRKKNFRFKKIGINPFFKALIIALATFALAYYYRQYTFLLWIETAAWIYFSWILFGKALRWANRVSMGDDLAFFGLRILGGIVTLVGTYILFATVIASTFVKGSAPQAIPIYCLLGGLILLGVFIAFRTNRRHHVVGVWGA